MLKLVAQAFFRYGVGVSSFDLTHWQRRFFLGTVLFLGCWMAAAQTKFIRLRNEVIATTPASKTLGSLQRQAVEARTSGLFLIQFEDRLQSVWQEQLRHAGVALLRSVPDDAFVAQLDQAKLSGIWAMPFVRWVGEYRADHKIHEALHASFKNPPPGKMAPVSVLLSPRATAWDTALARRLLRNIRHASQSGFGKVLQGEISFAQLPALARSSGVLWIEPAPKFRLLDEVASKIVGGDAEGHPTAVQQLGFDGKGVTVAVADSGLQNGDKETMHPDLAGRVDEFFYYGALTDASDGHSHGTHVTGIIAGDGAVGETDENGFLYGLGVAPKSHIVAQRIFDGAGGYEAPDSYGQLTRDAVSAGAAIGSNSWGEEAEGRYDISAMEFDALVRDADIQTPGDQPYILEFSAGNAGPRARSIYSPAVGKNVIATGASQNNRFDLFIYDAGQEAMADFSSRGPCEDGRIKPDVVAPGTWIASLQSASASDENAWLPISSSYQYQGGTSQAGPHVSGAAAVFVQYYRETHTNAMPSPALVKAALINSAVDMDNELGDPFFGTGPVPNDDEGWGRVDLTELIGSDRSFEFVDQTEALATGQTYQKRFYLASSLLPLKVTLAYTDVPGFPPVAIPALINDLDLEVIAPNGTTYRGNQFLDGESVTLSSGTDAINNVEAVHLSEPDAGEYVVRVQARNVVEDARKDTGAIDQDFALVISGDLPLPGKGVVILDRTAYTAPSLIGMKLIDFDLAGQPSATVLVKSSSEPNGEVVRLDPAGPFGVFAGSIATATGLAAADALLQIQHGDTIEAIYQDASPAGLVSTLARADLMPPVLTDVRATNRFGKEIISWLTDERANAVVRYGTNGVFSLAVTNLAWKTAHEVILPGMVDGVTYQFIVVSADEAGNVSTNDNNGNYFTFVAMPAATVLLVDAYEHAPDDESIEIPIQTYTEALDETGVSYEIWSVSQNGSPKTSDLRPFRVVMWRINDSFYDSTSLSPAQQTVLQEYLNGGGSFFMASMEILTRLGDSPFRTNVLQVQEFTAPESILEECPTCDQDHGVPSIVGTDFDPVASGIDLTLDYSLYPVFELEPIFPNIGPDLGDTFTTTTNAVPILVEPASGKPVGIRYPRTGQDSSGRVIFLAFPLEAVPSDGPAPNNRANLLRNILSFLAPGFNGLGTIALDNIAYTLPSRLTVEVADSDLTGKRNTTIQVYSDSATNGQPVKLTETVRSGLFRGFFVLVPTNNPPAAGELRAQEGDLIWAEYFDASAKGIVRAFAHVDTQPVTITNLTVEPDYEEAVVKWETSEPTDALAQFGESTFLERTAYRASLKESHELRLAGLQPDRSYYFQVTSHDLAGNTTVDDNNGKLYLFRTLKPALPPWFEDFEKGGTNWTVFNGDETQGGWQMGIPNNGLETAAHSPANAWGSNLNGEPIDYAQTFLISPAIELTGGNTATLRFWHSYDFTADSISEAGRVMIFTNQQSQPANLAELGDLTFGWAEVEIDLTSYLGSVVQLVWYYELFDISFDPINRPGWLVDDVSVEVTNIFRSTIQITNNLAQARFTVTGPTPFAGEGWSFTTSNALTGEYVINFGDVPYYQTPAPQTNVLTATNRLIFQGHYTIPDLDHNGLSDLWEQQVFGGLSSDRTASTDSDGDGVADYAEFVAGTDPTDPGSFFGLDIPVMLSAGRIRLEWSSSPGCAYRVLGSANAVDWTPFSDWLRAIETLSSHTIPALNSSQTGFFRLEVRP